MRNSRKKGYYFYRTLFISILLCIAITSAVIVVRYFDRYEEKIDKIYSNQMLLHSYINQILSNQIISSAQNLKTLSNVEDLSSSNFDEKFHALFDNRNGLDVLMILDGKGIVKDLLMSEDALGEDYANVFSAEEAGAIENKKILITSISQEISPSNQQLITMVVPSLAQPRISEYLFGIIKADNMIEEIESSYYDNLTDIFGSENSGYSYRDKTRILLTTGNDEIYKNLQFDLNKILESDGIFQNFSKNGLYTISPFNLNNHDIEFFKLNDSVSDIHLVTYIPYEVFLSVSQEVFTNQMGFGMILFSILLMFFFVISAKMNDSNYNQELVKHYTTYDFQTGCYNKDAGIGFLSKVFELSKRNSSALSLVSLNISKHSVNTREDDYCSLIETLSNRIRQSDFVIRMSDHGFLIALYDCNQNDASEIINNAFMSLDQDYEKNMMVWGIADSVNIETGQLDELIREANSRMKRNIKKSRIDHMINELNK